MCLHTSNTHKYPYTHTLSISLSLNGCLFKIFYTHWLNRIMRSFITDLDKMKRRYITNFYKYIERKRNKINSFNNIHQYPIRFIDFFHSKFGLLKCKCDNNTFQFHLQLKLVRASKFTLQFIDNWCKYIYEFIQWPYVLWASIFIILPLFRMIWIEIVNNLIYNAIMKWKLLKIWSRSGQRNRKPLEIHSKFEFCHFLWNANCFSFISQ